MPDSPAHRFGQIIGNYFEAAIEEFLLEYSSAASGFYLDGGGARKARGGKKSLVWKDATGNKHKLDYVIERGGTDESFGDLSAIIEVAWRSYVKHSKNKVQEIEGAVGHIVKLHDRNRPFKAAILAGDFTEPSLGQLRSHGFDVVYFDKKELNSVFKKFDVDIDINKDTTKDLIEKQIKNYENLSNQNKDRLEAEVKLLMKDRMESFVGRLNAHLQSKLLKIYIAIRHSESLEFSDVEAAINYLNQDYSLDASKLELSDYLIIIEYSSGTKVEIRATSKQDAILNLNKFLI